VVAWGLGSAYRAISRNFKDDLHTERMSETTRRWTTRAGVVDYGALQKLAHQTFGPLLLGVVAAGITIYGLFYFVRAAYRKV
jgi:hypothetical protein